MLQVFDSAVRAVDAAWREDDASFRAFMDQSPAIAWMKDEFGRFVYVNAPMERLFRLRGDEFRARTDYDFLSDETARKVRENDARVLESGRPTQFIETAPTPDGVVRTWIVIKFPFQCADGRRLIGGMGVDISELKSLEGQLADQLQLANSLNDELLAANRRLEELATTDGLTGLKNYRYFAEALDSALSLARRKGRPLSVAMLDVDHFKRYNDAFGHQRGDDVLGAIAAILRSAGRGYDLVARYGGEEFVALLPDTGDVAGRGVADRFRHAVERYPWPLQPVTISVGVATLSESTRDAGDLIRQADIALYLSKRQGRNRVTHWSETNQGG